MCKFTNFVSEMSSIKIIIINGPNLNLVGHRDKSVYGDVSFDVFLKQLEVKYGKFFAYFQSNIEGEIINALHDGVGQYDGVILNAGGYTHTSVAIADAVKSVKDMGLPTVEVHMSNILAREEFRHISFISPVADGSIMGFGMKSYELALDYFIQIFNEKN